MTFAVEVGFVWLQVTILLYEGEPETDNKVSAVSFFPPKVKL